MKMTADIETIFERVYVETPVDTDGDGKADLIAAYVRRPASTLSDERVPAVFVANPYLMTCNEQWYIPHDVNRNVKAYPSQNIREEDIRFDFDAPNRCPAADKRKTRGFAETAVVPDNVEFECISDLYAHLNQLGYATVFCGGLGTLGSEGYTLTGSREEVMAFKSVIDWLNGRCRAFTDKTDNIEICASWCTGNVAMSAKSYLGTMCIAVAATGVDGLKTIIPEAGICSWYDYYRYGGLVLPAMDWQGDDLDILAKYCFSRAKDDYDYIRVKDGYAQALEALEAGEDRDSGNYNIFWDERNYLNQIGNFRASVFIIHGINDWNVKTNQCVPLLRALEKHGIERKMLLHQGEHIYVYNLKNAGVLRMIERWLDHYLRGADNGIEKEPKVLVESNSDQSIWMASDTWPPAGWHYEEFPLHGTSFDGIPSDTITSEGNPGTVTFTDNLAATVYDRARDNQKDWLNQLILSDDPGYKNRLKFIWTPPENDKPIRLSGTVKVSFDAAIDRRTAILSAMLADMGEECRIAPEQLVADDDDTFVFGIESDPSAYKVITRGWLNAQNRTSLWSKEYIEPGKFYHYEFEMVPTDHTLAAGHSLALILYGSDAQETLRPDTETRVTLRTDSIRVMIPFA